MRTDILGKALKQYHTTGTEVEILVSSNVSDVEITPASYFFRNYQNMTALEQLSMDLCTGPVLDIGAGAGCHSLYLQKDGFDVLALEKSTILCDLMKERGVKNIVNGTLSSFEENQQFQTILLLMNGAGIAQTFSGLSSLLSKLSSLLHPDGQIFMDSSDISALYYDEEGVMHHDLKAGQIGEITYRLELGSDSEEFPWLFLRYSELEAACSELNLQCELLMTREDSYLAKISQLRPKTHASSL